MLPDLKTAPDPDKLNLVYCKDAFAAGDLFLRDVKEGGNLLAGCVTWDPKTTEVADGSGGKAHVLTTSVNLLDHRGYFHREQRLRAGASGHGRGACGWFAPGQSHGARQSGVATTMSLARRSNGTGRRRRDELAKVHLSNLPENLAFFSGAIDAAGSFGGIYQAAVYSYGTDLIKDPVDADHFADLKHLKELEKSGEFADQKIAIKPIRASGGAAVEGDPVLSKDIRFLFAPNEAKLELANDGQPEEPGSHQEDAAGQPRLDGAAARARG